MPAIALVTCVALPEPDPDQQLLVEGLRAAGACAELLPWDDPAADPAAFDLCVLRSCWNYHETPAQFVRWLERAAKTTRLLNPLAVVRWNLHKSYLRELEQAGVPIVPTMWFRRHDTPDVRALTGQRRWAGLVVKPSISAASYRTRSFAAHEIDAAATFLGELLRDGDAMVQPHLSSFERPGEAAVVWIDGKATHTVVKAPRFDGEDEQVSAARPLTEDEASLTAGALRCVDEALLYARVDMVQDEQGQLCVSELELIEPSLFLLQSPSALDRFVAAVMARANQERLRADR